MKAAGGPAILTDPSKLAARVVFGFSPDSTHIDASAARLVSTASSQRVQHCPQGAGVASRVGGAALAGTPLLRKAEPARALCLDAVLLALPCQTPTFSEPSEPQTCTCRKFSAGPVCVSGQRRGRALICSLAPSRHLQQSQRLMQGPVSVRH